MGSVPENVEDLQISMQKFGEVDYVIFILMLVGCACVGVYCALGKKDSTDAATEYLMGGRKMKVFPIGLSLVVSFVSGISLLGIPTEMYLYGTKYAFMSIGTIMIGLVGGKVFLPVFHDMKLSSTYEYLERRFDKKVRLLGSILFSISLVCYLPIAIYVPALAFNQVTGLNIHLITPCVSLVCIFYTAIGGIKAVVWTDVIQTWLMIAGVFAVIIKGTIDVGGWQTVWQRSYDGGRIEAPSFELDFTDRHSFWSLSIGASVFMLQASILNQTMIQRFMALPTLSAANRALWIYIFGIIFFVVTCSYTGLVVYATYYDCDPLTTKLAQAKDQLVPLLVMRVLGDYPGVPGLFIAGIFSAALSSLSSGLNAMASIVLEDFVKPITSKKLSNRLTNIIMRSVVLLFGALCVILVFIIEKLGTVLQLTLSLDAITSGPSFGIFCGGILIPWMNEKGAFYGGLLSLAICGFVVLSVQNAIATGELKFQTKSVSVENCTYSYDVSGVANVTSFDTDNDLFPLFKVSYLWNTLLGGILTVTLAMIISYFTGFNDPAKVDPLCLSPVVRRFLPKKEEKTEKELQDLIKRKGVSASKKHKKQGKTEGDLELK